MKKTKFRKRPKKFKKMRENEEVSDYHIGHARHGCYEIVLKQGEKMIYLTNFRNKKAAEKFIEAHGQGLVSIDPETCTPTPDFK